MADIRINALATTAASTASDDFVAVDGSANGTRKLNAFSPTFGGNLTVSGTALLGTSDANTGSYFDYNVGIPGAAALWMKQTTKNAASATLAGGGSYTVVNGPSGGSLYLRIGNSDGITLDSSRNATLSGNLTVSGTGTSALTSSSSNLVVGSTTATSTNSVGVPQITAESDIYSSLGSIAHNNTNGNHGFLLVGKSRGTKASPTILADGDVFGELSFVAYDGAAYRTSGQIRSVIAGTPGASDLPTALDFRVAPDASATPATAMRIAPTGNLIIGSPFTDGGQKLQVNGTAAFTTGTYGVAIQSDSVRANSNAAGAQLTLSGYNADDNQSISLREAGASAINYYSIGGTTSSVGHRFFTGGVKASQTLKVYINDNGLFTTGDATFAGTGTFSGQYVTIGSGGTGSNSAQLLLSGSSASNKGPYIQFSRNAVTKGYFGTASAVVGGSSDDLIVYTSALAATFSGANTTFAGSIAIGNTVQTAVGVASTHKVTISIGGSTYYLLATNV